MALELSRFTMSWLLLNWLRLMLICSEELPCVVSIEIVSPELPLVRLMVTSSGDAEEELFSWPRLMTISGVADPLEAPVVEAPPRLMMISGTLEDPAVVVPTDVGPTGWATGNGTVLTGAGSGTVLTGAGVGPTGRAPVALYPEIASSACMFLLKVPARFVKADSAAVRLPDCRAVPMAWKSWSRSAL